MTSTQSAPIHYCVSIASIEKQTLAVELTLPSHSQNLVTLALPAWIPGSYMIRNFARHIIAIEATNASGDTIECAKLDKQQWQVKTLGEQTTIRYQIFANDLSVRSAYMNDEYLFFNGTSVFLCPVELEQLPCTMLLDLDKTPESWKVATSMPKSTNDKVYHCSDYADLIDYPVYVGVCQRREFNVENVRFSFVISGSMPFNMDRFEQDLTRICAHHLAFFAAPAPIEEYLFITLLSEDGYGGLEHRNSTALLYPRFELPFAHESVEPVSNGYINFLSLCAHELFHTWHVKRMRPEVMLNPDLSQEVYTNQLWIYEGFTSYYDELSLLRSKLIDAPKYLELLAQAITRVEQNPGRSLQSVAASSFDAWTKFYLQDANSVNHIVSYYTKGSLVALGLDLLLRRRSAQRLSLNDLMRVMWHRYGIDEIGTPDDVIEQLCLAEFGINVSDYLAQVVYGTEDVPLESLLPDIGVRLLRRPKTSSNDKGGKPSDYAPRHQFGATIKNTECGTKVVQVQHDMPAATAGLLVGDRLIAINQLEVKEDRLQRILDGLEGDHCALHILRDGRLVERKMPLLPAVANVVYLELVDAEKFRQFVERQ